MPGPYPEAPMKDEPFGSLDGPSQRQCPPRNRRNASKCPPRSESIRQLPTCFLSARERRKPILKWLMREQSPSLTSERVWFSNTAIRVDAAKLPSASCDRRLRNRMPSVGGSANRLGIASYFVLLKAYSIYVIMHESVHVQITPIFHSWMLGTWPQTNRKPTGNCLHCQTHQHSEFWSQKVLSLACKKPNKTPVLLQWSR